VVNHERPAFGAKSLPPRTEKISELYWRTLEKTSTSNTFVNKGSRGTESAAWFLAS